MLSANRRQDETLEPTQSPTSYLLIEKGKICGDASLILLLYKRTVCSIEMNALY